MIVQANSSITYSEIIRAWHRHLRGQVNYFLPIKGAIKVCAYDKEAKRLIEVVLSYTKPQILIVLGHYWHGFKALGAEPAYPAYFTTRLYDYEKPDEERRPWNDPEVIPLRINGRKDDPGMRKIMRLELPTHK